MIFCFLFLKKIPRVILLFHRKQKQKQKPAKQKLYQLLLRLWVDTRMSSEKVPTHPLSILSRWEGGIKEMVTF